MPEHCLNGLDVGAGADSGARAVGVAACRTSRFGAQPSRPTAARYRRGNGYGRVLGFRAIRRSSTANASSNVAGPVAAVTSSCTHLLISEVWTSAAANEANRGSTCADHVNVPVATVVCFKCTCAPIHFACNSPTVIRPAFGAAYVPATCAAVICHLTPLTQNCPPSEMEHPQ